MTAVPSQHTPPPAASPLSPALAGRLTAAGIGDITDPMAAWVALRAAEGSRTTGVDLYELVAAQRGLSARELPRALRLRLAYAAMDVLFPGHAVVPATDRGVDPLEIVDYDPDWPRQYARRKRPLARTLGASALRFEHVGSTAVPGLPAKPVIDVQISVADVADEARYVAELEAVGMQLRARDDARRFLRPFPGQPRDIHVHVCAAGSAWERDHLLFRDYLRAHPAARDDYAQAKRAAIRTWHDDRFAYTEAKTGVILDIMDAAERWATATAWALPPPRRHGRGRSHADSPG